MLSPSLCINRDTSREENKINNNSPNTNLDTPSIKWIEKVPTFGTGPKVNIDMEAYSPVVTLGRNLVSPADYRSKVGPAAICFSYLTTCNSKGTTGITH